MWELVRAQSCHDRVEARVISSTGMHFRACNLLTWEEQNNVLSCRVFRTFFQLFQAFLFHFHWRNQGILTYKSRVLYGLAALGFIYFHEEFNTHALVTLLYMLVKALFFYSSLPKLGRSVNMRTSHDLQPHRRRPVDLPPSSIVDRGSQFILFHVWFHLTSTSVSVIVFIKSFFKWEYFFAIYVTVGAKNISTLLYPFWSSLSCQSLSFSTYQSRKSLNDVTYTRFITRHLYSGQY